MQDLPDNKNTTYKKDLFPYEKGAQLLASLNISAVLELLKWLPETDAELLKEKLYAQVKPSEKQRENSLKTFFSYLSNRSQNISSASFYQNIAKEGAQKGIGGNPSEILYILKESNPNELASYLKNEKPFTIACLLWYLPPVRVAEIIQQLSFEEAIQVLEHLYILETKDVEQLNEMDKILTQQWGVHLEKSFLKNASQPSFVFECLKQLPPSERQRFSEALKTKTHAGSGYET